MRGRYLILALMFPDCAATLSKDTYKKRQRSDEPTEHRLINAPVEAVRPNGKTENTQDEENDRNPFPVHAQPAKR